MFNKLKNKKCIVGCSGGPDSMALLDMAIKHGCTVVVAHVNYHKRETALRDQKIVENYCEKKKIPLYVHDACGFSKGNFQDWARKVRYRFFKEIVEKEKGECLLVAHQFDDVLETYIMQKRRNSIPSFWGILENNVIEGMKVIRPILNYTKKELIEYCAINNVEYGIDETNDQLIYKRNSIRKELEQLSFEEKEVIFNEIKQKNIEYSHLRTRLLASLSKQLSLNQLMESDNREMLLVLWIKKFSDLQISNKMSKELIKQLQTSRNIEILLSKYVKLSKSYNVLEMHEIKDVSYSYVLDKIEMLKTPYFEITDKGSGIEAITLNESDFPITIRNAKHGDFIMLHFGKKKLSRWFIDRKIPQMQRKTWPVMVNCKNEVIFVAKIGSDCKHYSNNPTCFMLK